jgi:glycosyltransferase involved in cell wall biosynthesis
LKPVVLQLIDSFSQGGSERQALQLTRLLRLHDRFDVKLACLKDGGALRSEVENLNLGPIPSFPLNSFYDVNAVIQLRSLVSHLRSERVRILQTHDFYTNVFGMAAGAIARIPVRIAAMRETAGMRTEAQKKAQRIAYSLAHHVVGNSEAVKRQLIEEGIGRERISVIYNGLDLARISPKLDRAGALKSLSLPEDDEHRPQIFVTIVANMRHEVKDYPMFLRAARQVVNVIPEIRFLLAGEGELTDSLRALAEEYGILDRVFFLGRCSHVAELLNISEICVLTSKAEGFSNSILEYMAAGRPVVATDVGGAREAIIDGCTGFLVPATHDVDMAERLVALLKDPKRAREMGAAGKRRVEEKFSCETQLQSTEKLYNALLTPLKGVKQKNG